MSKNQLYDDIEATAKFRNEAKEISVGSQQPQTELKVFHDVIINKVSNGFIVKVKCKTFVAQTWSEVASGLAEYYIDPEAAERKYCSNYVL